MSKEREKLDAFGRIPQAQIEGYRKMFSAVVEKGKECIGLDEFEVFFNSNFGSMPRAEMESLLETIDADGSGSIEFKEFAVLIHTLNQELEEGGFPGALPYDEYAALSRGTDLTVFQVRKLHRRFKALDANGDGGISLEEFKRYPKMASNPVLPRVVEVFDADGGGTVDFKEFVRVLAIFGSNSNDEMLKFLFRMYDIDRDGWISNKDFFLSLRGVVGACKFAQVDDGNFMREILVGDISDDDVQDLVDHAFAEIDKDGDGLISFQEFREACYSGSFAKQLIPH